MYTLQHGRNCMVHDDDDEYDAKEPESSFAYVAYIEFDHNFLATITLPRRVVVVLVHKR